MIQGRCTVCGDCWEWKTGAKNEMHRKHPQICHEGKRGQLVRRVAYKLAKGQLRDDLKLVQSCGNPYCLNPEHQLALTEKQKCLRAAKAGAWSSPVRGKKIADARRKTLAKLTHENVQEIRGSDASGKELAQVYGVCESMVSAIRRGKLWKDYSNPFSGLGA